MDYITYKKEKLPIRVSYYALKQYQKETGKDLSDLDENLENLEILLYHSLIAGHKSENKEMILPREEMEFILDESMGQFNAVIISSFPTPDQLTTDTKKNQ